jgi:ATP-dependent RNA helicase DeaD
VLTHRSGRTGRAGKKGTSILLVPPGMRERVRQMLRRAGVEAAWLPAPQAADVRNAADERLAAELVSSAPADPRLLALADKLIAGREPREVVATLLARSEQTGASPPADITPIHLPNSRAAQTTPPPRGGEARGDARARGPLSRRGPLAGPQGAPAAASGSFVPFRINWGERQGADARRLLALVCRRGGIRGSEVGAIRIGVTGATFEVAANVAESFAAAVREPDARDPRVHITPMQDGSASARRERPGPSRWAAAPPKPPAPDSGSGGPELSRGLREASSSASHASPLDGAKAAPHPERAPSIAEPTPPPVEAAAPPPAHGPAPAPTPRTEAPQSAPRDARTPAARGGFLGAASPRKDRNAAPPAADRDHAPRTPYRGPDGSTKSGRHGPATHGKSAYGKPAYGKKSPYKKPPAEAPAAPKDAKKGNAPPKRRVVVER